MLRALWWGGPSLLIACGGAASPPPSANPPPTADAGAPAAPAAPISDPAGLTTLPALDPAICAFVQPLAGRELDLYAGRRLPPFARIFDGWATITTGNAGAFFAEVKTPSWTARGIPSAQWLTIHPSRWLGFGGVFFPGIHDALSIDKSHDGTLVLSAPTNADFELVPSARTMVATCAQIAIRIDPSGAMEQAAPPPFEPAAKTKPQAMILALAQAVPLSAEADGPAAGSFNASVEAKTVTLLETRGKRARIRWEHIAGWVDASLLSTPKPVTAKQKALQGAATMSMTAVASSGTARPAVSATKADLSVFVCAANVRLFASGVGGIPTVVGSVPAGARIRLTDQGTDSAHVSLDGAAFAGSARAPLSVPLRDLVSGCTPASGPEPAATSAATAPRDPKERAPDAIDLLDMTPGQRAAALLNTDPQPFTGDLPPIDLSDPNTR